MGQIKIRRACRGDSAALTMFWDEVKSVEKGVAFFTDLDALQWRFDNPFFANGGAVWVAEEEGKIIGHLAASPCPVYNRGEIVEATWCQDFYVTGGPQGTSRRPVGGLLASRLRGESNVQNALGTPGLGSAAVRVYERLGFTCRGAVPFYFLVNDPQVVLEKLAYLQSRPALGALSSLCSRLRIPAFAISAATWITGRRRLSPLVGRCSIRETSEWGSEADDLWERARGKFTWICDRSARYLNWRYQSSAYRRFQVHDRAGSYLGWVVCRVTQMDSNPYFGSLRVGTIVDVLSDPANPEAVAATLAAGVWQLTEVDADIIICNLSERRYRNGIRRLGFWPGPSRFLFFSHRLEHAPLSSWHLTRGDSDGDYNL